MANTNTKVSFLREYILFSRLGKTNPDWTNLHDAGRLDVVYECIIASLFLSHGIRKNVVFHCVLNGPPNPPQHIAIEGETLHDARTDQQTWQQILKNVLAKKAHPGTALTKTSFETLVKIKSEQNARIYILEEGGKNVTNLEFSDNQVFILGDHIGLPKTTEKFALRYGEKVSLGKQPYLAASCITILNYLQDIRHMQKAARSNLQTRQTDTTAS
jgi:tRNA (pseudouridine54-N1)-methyltransferase